MQTAVNIAIRGGLQELFRFAIYSYRSCRPRGHTKEVLRGSAQRRKGGLIPTLSSSRVLDAAGGFVQVDDQFLRDNAREKGL